MPHRKRQNSSGVLEDDSVLSFSGINIPEDGDIGGYVKVEDLADFQGATNREKQMLVAMSKLEQWSDWQTDAIEVLSDVLTRMVVNESRLKSEQTKHSWLLAGVKWIGMIVGAGLVTLALQRVFK